MAETLLHGLEVGTAGEKPGGVSMSQVVHPHADVESCGVDRGLPNLSSKPVARDVSIGIPAADRARIVLPS